MISFDTKCLPVSHIHVATSLKVHFWDLKDKTKYITKNSLRVKELDTNLFLYIAETNQKISIFNSTKIN